MTPNDKQSISKLLESAQKLQAELQIVSDRADDDALQMANNKLLIVIMWLEEANK